MYINIDDSYILFLLFVYKELFVKITMKKELTHTSFTSLNLVKARATNSLSREALVLHTQLKKGEKTNG